ncbi:hypothetical protein PoB_006619900 [Plakobranchus ocellatus]|uniref:Uncharacterized protein n=1 Tax=Plakobranchus ocellatus TaxID=259542 RepID=A0AAV4D694_9GAST|nr:hypothetical protein PoB_006619900 [Plakobranchus ocellatus]
MCASSSFGYSSIYHHAFLFVIERPVHNKVISGFQALRQARAPEAGLEPATEGSLQISGWTRKPLCYRRSPQQCDLRLSGPPPGQSAGSGARTRDRRVPADIRADSQATVLPTQV